MKYAVPIVLLLLAALGAWSAVDATGSDQARRWYISELRGDIFAAALTLSGFMFSVATFVTVKAGELVRSDAFIDHLDRFNRGFPDEAPSIDQARSELRGVVAFLGFTVVLSLLVAVCHVSAVFCAKPLFAISIALAAISLVAVAAGLGYGFLVVQRWLGVQGASKAPPAPQ